MSEQLRNAWAWYRRAESAHEQMAAWAAIEEAEREQYDSEGCYFDRSTL